MRSDIKWMRLPHAGVGSLLEDGKISVPVHRDEGFHQQGFGISGVQKTGDSPFTLIFWQELDQGTRRDRFLRRRVVVYRVGGGGIPDGEIPAAIGGVEIVRIDS